MQAIPAYLKRSLLLWLLLFPALQSMGQSPVHFIIGERELSGTDVYSLEYHPEGLLYAATNYGLFVYRNGSFQQIPFNCAHKGNSLFSLRRNSKNELFCANLYGQIFKLGEAGLESHLETPASYMNEFFDFVFDDKDRIVIRSRLYALYDGKWEVLYEPKGSSPSTMNGFDPAHIAIPSPETSDFLLVRNGKIEPFSGDGTPLPQDEAHRLIARLGGRWLSMTNTATLADYTQKTAHRLSESGTYSLLQADIDELWLRSTRSGARQFRMNGDMPLLGKRIFEKTFISDVEKSPAGTYFLGTFGKGIIVVPDMDAQEYPTGGSEIGGLCHIPDLTAAALPIAPSIRIELPDSGQLLTAETRLFYLKGVPFHLSETHPNLLYQIPVSRAKEGSLGTIKDAERISDRAALVATSRGIFKVGEGLEHLHWVKNGTGNNWWRLPEVSGRCYAVSYAPLENAVYFASGEGLQRVNKEGRIQAIQWNGAPVHATDLSYADSLIICATQDQGVLLVREGEVIRQFTEKDGLKDKLVRKVLVHEGKMYVAHRAGVQIYDFKSRQWQFPGGIQAGAAGSVTDFLILKDRLWLASGSRLSSVSLDAGHSDPGFELLLSPLQLGEQRFSLSEPVSVAYDQGKLNLPVEFRGIEFEKDARIEYRLNDGPWRSVPATTSALSYDALAPGDYLMQVRVNHLGNYSHQQEIAFTITPPFWQRGWFFALAILLISTLFYLFYRNRIRKAQLAQQRELEAQQLKTDMLESELRALRSQMNPHFIFNSLNAIQDLILKEDTESSYDYIVLFAKLVRNTLNYSNLEYIPIEKELEFLDVYLSLEKLRFKKDLTFSITYSGDKEIDVPSLIVQPFIENALVHGLMHKKGEKKLTVSFELGETLVCTITDNGVGRAKAREIQARQGGHHESFAMKAIKQRLHLLNQQSAGKGEGTYQVEDLMEAENPVGTRVTIILPHKARF